MSLTAIKSSISELSPRERAELMHFMVDMLAEETLYLSENWKTELDAREIALKNGTSVGKPVRDVLAKYGQR
ncbi:MAG: addiction module protein [Bacteroidota bacterium]